jgi:hypothetical protein
LWPVFWTDPLVKRCNPPVTTIDPLVKFHYQRVVPDDRLVPPLDRPVNRCNRRVDPVFSLV